MIFSMVLNTVAGFQVALCVVFGGGGSVARGRTFESTLERVFPVLDTVGLLWFNICLFFIGLNPRLLILQVAELVRELRLELDQLLKDKIEPAQHGSVYLPTRESDYHSHCTAHYHTVNTVYIQQPTWNPYTLLVVYKMIADLHETNLL